MWIFIWSYVQNSYMYRKISLHESEMYTGILYSSWLVVWNIWIMTFHRLGMSSSQLTNSYFSEGQLYHQPEFFVHQKLRSPSEASQLFASPPEAQVDPFQSAEAYLVGEPGAEQGGKTW
jgi:hypothetical protein